MSEKENSHEELEAFREEFKDAVESTIFILTSGQDDGPFQIDPFSLGLGEQTLSELGPSKQSIVREELYRLAGITKETAEAISKYQAVDDETISVSVFEAQGINEEGEEQPIYLHEIEHEGGELDWQLSSSADPLL
jgi:hypothetical protein